MEKWKQIEINKQNIETNTANAVLIKMPNKSKYPNYKFWHPIKLVKKGRHSFAVNLSYTNKFEFKIFRTGKNKNVLSEMKISAKEFAEAFSIMDENILSKQSETIILHTPEKIDLKNINVTINKELIDD